MQPAQKIEDGIFVDVAELDEDAAKAPALVFFLESQGIVKLLGGDIALFPEHIADAHFPGAGLVLHRSAEA